MASYLEDGDLPLHLCLRKRKEIWKKRYYYLMWAECGYRSELFCTHQTVVLSHPIRSLLDANTKTVKVPDSLGIIPLVN